MPPPRTRAQAAGKKAQRATHASQRAATTRRPPAPSHLPKAAKRAAKRGQASHAPPPAPAKRVGAGAGQPRRAPTTSRGPTEPSASDAPARTPRRLHPLPKPANRAALTPTGQSRHAGSCSIEFSLAIVGIRGKLDRRLTTAVLGPQKVELASKRQLDAIRNIRLGRLTSVKLGHLHDKDDSSTPEDPLKGTLKDGNTSSFFLAVGRLQAALAIAQPASHGPIIGFFDALSSDIATHVKNGASDKDVSAFYRSVIMRVSKPATRLAANEAGGSALLCFDVDFITQQSEYRRQLLDAISKSQAEKAGSLAAQNEMRKLGKHKAPAKPNEKGPKKPKPDEDDESEKEKGGGIAKLQGRQMPSDQQQKEIRDKEGKKKKPSGKGKPVNPCMFHFHPDGKGCVKGDECHFHHGGE